MLESNWWFTAFVPPVIAGLVVAAFVNPGQAVRYARWVRGACVFGVFRCRMVGARKMVLKVLEETQEIFSEDALVEALSARHPRKDMQKRRTLIYEALQELSKRGVVVRSPQGPIPHAMTTRLDRIYQIRQPEQSLDDQSAMMRMKVDYERRKGS